MTGSLAAYLATWGDFDWREANCAHFALRWAAPAALDGVPMPASPLGMRDTLRALGVSSLRQAVTQRVGPEIAPSLAQAGDVVLWGRTLGICTGRVFAAPLQGRGVVFCPMSDAEVAWRRSCAG